jgi:hypothetical protein
LSPFDPVQVAINLLNKLCDDRLRCCAAVRAPEIS